MDNWHPYGSQVDKHDNIIVYDLGLALNAEVKDMIANN